jgi:hypothetical protein
MTKRTETLPLLMAYAVGDKFKIGTLAAAKFTFNYLGEIVAFELLDERKDNMKLVSLENGEHYDWDADPERIFLPLSITIEEDYVKWTFANGMPGGADTEDGENQEEFDEIYNALQRNFAYLRERAIREQPVVIYPHGLPSDAYLNALDGFIEELFCAEDYDEWLDDTKD